MSALLDPVACLDPQRKEDLARNDAAMNTDRSIVPYKAGKVQIGRCYIPRPPRVEGDAVAIQRALLEPRTASPLTGWRAVVGMFWRVC